MINELSNHRENILFYSQVDVYLISYIVYANDFIWFYIKFNTKI